MAIKIYTRTRNGEKYKVYQVIVYYGGKRYQSYFPLDRYEEAKACNAKYERDKAIYQARKAAQKPAPRRPLNRTAVEGIRIGLRKDYRKPEQDRWSFHFDVAAATPDGERRNTRRVIKDPHSLDQTWSEACQALAEIQGLRRPPALWRASIPPLTQFAKVLRFKQEQGNNVPDEVLDAVRDSASGESGVNYVDTQTQEKDTDHDKGKDKDS